MKLMIAGDFAPTDNTMELFEKNDVKTLFGGVPALFAGADRVVVNVECALTHGQTPIRKFGPNLKATPECAGILRSIGVTDCALSNNHVFDFGPQGLEDTLRALEQAGLPFTGVGMDEASSRRPHLIEHGGKTVALIAVCEHEYTYALPGRMGATPYDPYDTMADIRAAVPLADYVVVLYHGGKEFCRYPSPRLRKLCRAMADQGADAVICQHSHCVGCYEEYNGTHILYGQGNFHFVKESAHECWYTGLLVELQVEDTLRIRFHPIKMLEKGIDLARGAEGEAILAGLARRNEHLADDRWLEGWREFCLGMREQYLRPIGNAFREGATEQENEHFRHYLDCEAHTDVWRELCKTWNTTDW